MPRSDERLRGMRIVYLHGIGCSRGTCERHIHLPALREAGATVICPNLHTGWEDWTECNSLLRHMLRQPLLWACIAGTIGVSVAIGLLVRSNVASLAVAACLALSTRVIDTSFLTSRLARGAMDDAIAVTRQVARNAIREACKSDGGIDLVVGYSWGGGLAAVLAGESEWAWRGPTLLIAPAVVPMVFGTEPLRRGICLHPATAWRAAVTRASWIPSGSGGPATMARVLLPGDDGKVPVEPTQKWAQTMGLPIAVVEGAWHEIGRTPEELDALLDAAAQAGSGHRSASPEERERWIGPGVRCSDDRQAPLQYY